MVEIWCPKCAWRPDASSLWVCESSCGCSWNTFQTRGICPKCGKQWKYTQCLACGRQSLHEEWYHGGDDADENAFYEYINEELIWEETPEVIPA